MITAYPSSYKVLPLQVMSNNKNVISFPQKCLTRIKLFSVKLFRTRSYRVGSPNISAMNDTFKEAT